MRKLFVLFLAVVLLIVFVGACGMGTSTTQQGYTSASVDAARQDLQRLEAGVKDAIKDATTCKGWVCKFEKKLAGNNW